MKTGGVKKVMGVWNIEARRAEVKHCRRESRGAVAAEGGEGVPLGEGSGEEAVPPPQKIF